ncbi:MAG: DUF4392 domain-containing protein [bacterium]|nr:DUF4392 domain-containing protein [bacterium]
MPLQNASNPDNLFSAIEPALITDIGSRGIGKLSCPGDLQRCCEQLLTANRVGIATGFYLTDSIASETDGPLGALLLSVGLHQLKKTTVVISDRYTAPLLRRCVDALQLPCTVAVADAVDLSTLDHLIAIERIGPASDAASYSMHGVALQYGNDSLADLFETACSRGIPTTGIGDGGNEIGMGKVAELVVNHIPRGALIGCRVATDSLLVCGISNWGIWGILAGMSFDTGTNLLPTRAVETEILESLVREGAIDGVTKQAIATVDGFTLEEQFLVRERIERLLAGLPIPIESQA